MANRRQDLEIVVDPALDEPVYVQIARQVRDAVASGVLAPGAILPSVRALASDLGVNLNTVARAYRRLAAEGYVEIENRSGARVAAPGARDSRELRDRLSGELSGLLGRMRQAGFAATELRQLAQRQIASLFER